MEENNTITGTGLLTLDIILNGSKKTPPKMHAGGSFGNVITILSFLGFETFPISRLADNDVTNILLADIEKWSVNTNFVFKEEKGSTPIIIHRILKDKEGKPKHKFEFRNPENGKYLPSFRPFLSKRIEDIENEIPKSKVFYFDRVSRSSIDLARLSKEKGSIVYFEPSSYKETKQFQEALAVSDIIKYSSDRIKDYKTIYPKQNGLLEIETKGVEGTSYRFKSDKWKQLPPFLLDNVTDTAGAGDWCSSGIIKLISQNGSLYNQTIDQIEEALNLGQAFGAINCLFDGARGSMYNLTLEELDNLIIKLLNRQLENDIVLEGSNDIDNILTYSDVETLFNSI